MTTELSGRERAGFGVTLILASLAMFGPFSIDTVFPAFTDIGAQFGASTVALQQITSVYLLSFAVMSLLHGPLSDAVGRKPVIVIGLTVYALASVGCALASNLPMLLIFRALQGMSAGSGQIVSRAVVRDLFDGPRAQKLMSQIAMIFSVAPAIAPIVGGWILGVASWPWIFWSLAAYGTVITLVVLFALAETHPPQRRRPLRVRAMLAGLAEVAGSPRFLRLAFTATVTFAGQFIYIVSAPIFVVDLLGKGAQDFWIFFVPMIGGMILGSLVTGRLAGRIHPRSNILVGLGIASAAGILNVVLAALPATSARLPWAVVGPSLIAFGAAIAFPVLQLVMLDMFPTQRGSAASASTFLQLLLNATLAGVVAPLVTSTVLQLALTSLGFILVGGLLYLVHTRFTPMSQLRAEAAAAAHVDQAPGVPTPPLP